MPSKEEVLSIKGLATFPNEYGELPPGTLQVAENVLVHRPGVLEPLAGPVSQATWSSQLATKIFPLEGSSQSVVIQGNSQDTVVFQPAGTILASGNLSYGSANRSLLFPSMKTHLSQNRGRTILTERSSPLIVESAGCRIAGLPPPTTCAFQSFTINVPVLHNENFTTYCAVFRYDDGAGYTYQGAPSPQLRIQGPGLSQDNGVTLRVYWSRMLMTNINATNTYVELYRSGQDPVEDAVDEDFALVMTQKLTSTDITNRYVTLVDQTSDDARGQSLYTNQFEDGAKNPNFIPPTSIDTCTHKGTTFYVATSAWNQQIIKVKTGWGNLTTNNDPTGVGQRRVSLTLFNGSATGAFVTPGVDDLGAYVGQTTAVDPFVGVTGFAAGTTIMALGPGAFVSFSNPWTLASGDWTILTQDTLTINGVATSITDSLEDFLVSLAATAGSTAIMNPDRPYRDSTTAERIEGFSFQLISPIPGPGSMTLTGTNPQNYSPDLGSANALFSKDPRTNRIYFSREQQPEVVQPLSYFFVGGGSVLRILPTESAVYAYCSDGVYRIDGDGLNWRVDPVDNSTVIIQPEALDSMRGNHYFWSNKGLTMNQGGTLVSLSDAVQGSFRTMWDNFLDSSSGGVAYGTTLACDAFRGDVWLYISDVLNGPTQVNYGAWIYNVDTGAFTNPVLATNEWYAAAYNPYRRQLQVIGATGMSVFESSTYRNANVRFNPLVGSALGDLKQWMSMVLSLESTDSFSFTPTFDGTAIVVADLITGKRTYVVPVPRRAALCKDLTFGFTSVPGAGTGFFQLLGLSARVRVASETLTRKPSAR